jgi:hypothetical protein
LERPAIKDQQKMLQLLGPDEGAPSKGNINHKLRSSNGVMIDDTWLKLDNMACIVYACNLTQRIRI